MRAGAEGDQAAFDQIQDDLEKAAAVTERLTRVHYERDAELDLQRQLVSGLLERWQAVLAQIDLRHHELEALGRQMVSYRKSYQELIRWIEDAKRRQEKIQAVPVGDSKVLAEQLNQEKVTIDLFSLFILYTNSPVSQKPVAGL